MLRALDLTKSYYAAPLFDGLSLTLAPGERAGLVGLNGAGKSTLLRLLAGLERPDRGLITTTAKDRLPAPGGARRRGDARQPCCATRWARPAQRSPNCASPAISTATPHALERAEATGAWAAEARAEEVRRRLAIDHLPRDRPLHRFSGGEQARALLAATLLEDPDVLLLDEPTDDLDGDGLAWLEGFLADFGGALLVVSHDRHFLDAVVEAHPRARSRRRARDPTRAPTPTTAPSVPVAARASSSSSRPRRSGAGASRPTSPTPATTPAAASAAPAAWAPTSRSAMPRRSRRRPGAREHRLERAIKAETWVERPREAAAVRLKLDAAADRGRRVAAAARRRRGPRRHPGAARRRSHPPRWRARRGHGRERCRQDDPARAPPRHARAHPRRR